MLITFMNLKFNFDFVRSFIRKYDHLLNFLTGKMNWNKKLL